MKKYRLANNESGATAVEFALVLPVILIFVFGIIEFGLLMFNKQVLTNACREGARLGTLVRENRDIEDTLIKNTVLQYAQNHLVTFGAGDSFEEDDIDIRPEEGHPRCFSFWETPDQTDRCSIIVTINFNWTYLYLGILGIDPINIRAVSRMYMD